MTDSVERAVSVKDFAGLFFALLAVASITLVLLELSASKEDTSAHIDHIQEVYRYSQGVLLAGAEADKDTRSYALTGDSKYLSLYRDSKQALREQAETLTKCSRSPVVQKILQERLHPSLEAFIRASDDLIVKGNERADLKRQEESADACKKAISAIQTEQLLGLQKRKNDEGDMSTRIAVIEPVILAVALLAILSAVVAVQKVVRVDRLKIATLQLAVEQTLKAERAASEALLAAKQSNQLKSQFMANISHEIRTPMTGILGTAELLEHENLPDPAAQYARVLLRSARQMLTVLNDLLNFSQLERHNCKLENQSFALRKIIAEATQAAQSNACERNLSVVSEVAEAVPNIICADEDKIRQVLSTLLSNSLKFTKEGGVQISVDCPEADVIRVAVTDTGIGIAGDDLPKVFQPFVQIDGGLRRTTSGVGLSLSIAKHLVELMSGQIGVMSAPGAGSIFWFTFKGDLRQ
jgi:signal transduction histidine kinase